jgi:class 3 adenylate cyclase
VLFADIAGSTQLGERLDPEAVRSLLARHFAEARTILERHGGTVEKFIGDAVMAVFGVPTAHEDDALRAVRAAAELLDAVRRANAGPGTPARLSIRIGINTGEVVTGAGSSETLVTGDAVNTAARLEQAAGLGEILIGMPTLELVHDAVEVERLEPIAAKGKTDPVAAARVLRVIGDVGRHRLEAAPMVGRESELATLTDAFERAVSSGAIRLVTVIAPAGVGKSRLLRELTAALADRATVTKGRCLPYGDGITYWPIREILHQLARIDEGHAPSEMRAMLHALQSPDESVEAIAALVGLDAPTQRQDELFWSARRVLEHAADRGPLVLLVEDLHWADDTLLDLLEYVASTAAGPILVVATARPELFDRRPGWKGTGMHLDLTALDGASANVVLSNQQGGDALPSELRERIVLAADGNPLFLEEMVAMLREGDVLQER